MRNIETVKAFYATLDKSYLSPDVVIEITEDFPESGVQKTRTGSSEFSSRDLWLIFLTGRPSHKSSWMRAKRSWCLAITSPPLPQRVCIFRRHLCIRGRWRMRRWFAFSNSPTP